MADDADIASDYEAKFTQEAIEKALVPIAEGAPGECDLCGEWSGRLVGGACAPCRDKYKLP